MATPKELALLQETLKIPLSKIEENGPFVKIYSGGTYIGNIPVLPVAGGRIFDTAEQNLNNLNWSLIYNNYKEQFQKLVSEQLNKDISITCSTFGKVYATDPDSQHVDLFACVFNGQKWAVYEMKTPI
jgi:hypothetical protein